MRKKFGTGDFDGVGAEAGSSDPVKPGAYVGILKRLISSEIKNGPNAGADRLRVGVQITGPKGAKRVDGTSAVGAWVWGGLNATEQGAGYLNQFLHAIAGAKTAAAKREVEKAFWGSGKFDGADVDADGNVKKIGRSLVVGSPDGTIKIGISTRLRPGQNPDDEQQADITKYTFPIAGKAKDDDDDDEADDDETDDDDEDSEDDEDDDDGDDGDDTDEREEELSGMSVVALRKEAKSAGVEASDIKGASKEDLIELILDAEADGDDGEDDESEEDADDEDEEGDDERAEELAAKSLVALRKEAKALDIDTKGLDKEELIEAILEAEDEDEDDADEDGDGDDEEEGDSEAEAKLRAELEKLALPALRKRAKEAELTADDYKGLDKAGIIDLIIENDPPF